MKKTNIETVVSTPPSPTVSSLLKFEEIPVSNYTGIPKINIPIISIQTLSKKVNINISLDYHPYSIEAKEIAPYTGLGWNLMAGGVISRTVRDIPDEYISLAPKEQRIGVYHDSLPDKYNTNYYYIAEGHLKGSDYYNNNDLQIEQFKWDAFEKGKYDTQLDLYQFNFMGITGRFYLKKIPKTHEVRVIRLDENTQYKIDVSYSFSSEYHSSIKSFKIERFTITDDKGVKYVFRDIEKTSSYTSSLSDLFSFPSFFSNVPLFHHRQNYLNTPSSFHLSEIYDNNNLIVKYKYDDNNEIVSRSTFINNKISYASYSQIRNLDLIGDEVEAIYRMKPEKSLIFHNDEIITKKIKEININGIGTINFKNSGNRLDTNLDPNSGALKLDEIIIKNIRGENIKKISFDYEYIDVPYPSFRGDLKRMALKSFKEYDENFSNYKSYSFVYEKKEKNKEDRIIKNPWGYFEIEKKGVLNKIEDKNFSTINVLKKMYLPTGGFIKFDYSPATYSYIGKKPVDNFDENPKNIVKNFSKNFNLTSHGIGSDSILLFDNTKGNLIGIDLAINTSQINDSQILRISKGSGGNQSYSCDLNEDKCDISILYPEKTTYVLNVFNSIRGSVVNIFGNLKAYSRNHNYTRELQGGGIKIDSIRYFESKDAVNPEISKVYNYSFFKNPLQSSGSLVFPEPIFEFNKREAHDFLTIAGNEDCKRIAEHNIVNIDYTSKTKHNNLSFQKTHGANVGYKNVTVKYKRKNSSSIKEIGFNQYKYTSPIDYPEVNLMSNEEDAYVIKYPYIPTKNIDYKRGLLKTVSSYDIKGNILKKIKNKYIFTNEHNELTGIKLASVNNCPYSFLYLDFRNYKSEYLYCQRNNGVGYDPSPCVNNWDAIDCKTLCEYFSTHITMHRVLEAVGESNLIKTEIKDYFYDNNNLKNIVTTEHRYKYNDYNKKISKENYINNLGDTITTKFYYPQDLLASGIQSKEMQELVNKNRIDSPVKTETYIDNEQISESITHYNQNSNTGNLLLPDAIYSSKGDISLDNFPSKYKKITYNRYDSKGNILEYTPENGIPVSIIWGYNKQSPIAKIEGITYAEIKNIAETLSTQSNLDIDEATEGVFRNQLNAIRQNTKLKNTLITTYTYDPLIGVTSITPPNGQTAYYKYDGFGRLKSVEDEAGNKLQDIKYNYRIKP